LEFYGGDAMTGKEAIAAYHRPIGDEARPRLPPRLTASTQ